MRAFAKMFLAAGLFVLLLSNGCSEEASPSISAAPVTVGTEHGLTGAYYEGTDFNTFVAARVDDQVNFNWANEAPLPGMTTTNYSVRWTGQVLAPVTSWYTFTTTSDDGVRLWVNGTELVSNWTLHGATSNSGTISLTAGHCYEVKMEYYQHLGDAVAALAWAHLPNGIAAVIPSSQLFPSTGSAPCLTIASLSASPQPLVTSTNISFTLSEGATVNLDIETASGTIVRHELTSHALPAGPNSISYNGHDDSANRLPSGSYSIVVSATDSAGHSTSQQVPLQIAGVTVVGATVGLTPFPTGTTYAQAAAQFDATVERTEAQAGQKVYLEEGTFPSTITENDDIAFLHSVGAAMFISCKPSRTLSSSQRTALGNFLDMLLANGCTRSNCWVTLWQEPNGNGAFATAADYIAYTQYYAPVVRRRFANIFDPSIGGQDDSDILSYYAGPSYEDAIVIDYYGSAYDRGIHADAIKAQANADHLPWGIGEYGAVGEPTNTPPTEDQWNNQYIPYLESLLADQQSRPEGAPFAFYFNGTSVNPNNIVPSSGTSYRKVPALQVLYDAVR